MAIIDHETEILHFVHLFPPLFSAIAIIFPQFLSLLLFTGLLNFKGN